MNKRTRKIVFNLVVIILLMIGFVWVCSRFVHLGQVEYTDNAQVRQQIVPVNSRVQGFIQKIYFDEYEFVHKGDGLQAYHAHRSASRHPAAEGGNHQEYPPQCGV